MSTPFLKSFDRTISVARLGSYCRPGESDAEALARYFWNASLSEALYSPLQHLEVGFRNSVHCEILKLTGNSNWLSQEHAVLQSDELEVVRKAKQALIDRGKNTDEGCLVNELGFGFWASLLDSRYDRLWPKIIAGVFPLCPRRDRSRTEISKIVTRIRKLRNAAFHHHSIWHWNDLFQRHREIHTVIGWICPHLGSAALKLDRFPQIAAAGEKMHWPILNEFLTEKPEPSKVAAVPASHVKFITEETFNVPESPSPDTSSGPPS